MPLYWGDLLADTLHLSRADFGSYVFLIGAYWRNRGPIRNDDEALRTSSRCSEQEWTRTKPILACFFSVTDTVWRHKRIDLELYLSVQNKDRNEKRTESARKAVELKRTKTVTDTVTDTVTGSPSPSPSPSPSQSPAQSPSPPARSARATELPEGFPKTEAEALQFSAMVGGASKDLTLKTWNKAMSRNGLDSKGQPIRSFSHYLTTELNYERERKTDTELGKNSPGRNRVQPDYSKGF